MTFVDASSPLILPVSVATASAGRPAAAATKSISSLNSKNLGIINFPIYHITVHTHGALYLKEKYDFKLIRPKGAQFEALLDKHPKPI